MQPLVQSAGWIWHVWFVQPVGPTRLDDRSHDATVDPTAGPIGWTDRLVKQLDRVNAALACYEQFQRSVWQNSIPRWWSGHHLEFFGHLKCNNPENITLHERLCMKRTSTISAFYYEIRRNYQQMVIQDGGPDAILNISVIQETTFMKIWPYMEDIALNRTANFQLSILRFDENDQQNSNKNGCRTPSWIVQSFQKLHLRKYEPTWKTLQETNRQNFNSFIMRFDENINKTVIQDGGQTPSWITRAFHICQKATMDFLNADFIPVPMTYNTSSHHWNCHGSVFLYQVLSNYTYKVLFFSNFSIVRWHWKKKFCPPKKVEMTPLIPTRF